MQHDSGRPSGPRVITASQAADLIDDGDCVYFGGSGGGHGVAEDVIEALRDRFERTGNPVDLTAASTVSIGDWQDTGFNHLAARGLLRRVINGGMNNCPKLAPAAIAGELECYTLPQGVLAQMARERAAGRPGVLTKVGIGTFVDPRQSGGRQARPTCRKISSISSTYAATNICCTACFRSTSPCCAARLPMKTAT